MITWVDVLTVIFALAVAGLGFWRGLMREIFVLLAGVIMGELLALLWGETWGSSASSDVQGLIRLGSLLFIVVFVGYGSALLMPRRQIHWWQRFAGAVIGLLNGLLLAAFSFRHIQDYFLQGRTDSVLKTSLIAGVLIDWLAWIFLAAVLGISVAVTVVALIRLARFIVDLAQPAAEVAPVAVPPAVIPEPERPAEPEPIPAAEVSELPPPATDEPTVPCPNCGQPVPFGAAYCPQCGKIIS